MFSSCMLVVCYDCDWPLWEDPQMLDVNGCETVRTGLERLSNYYFRNYFDGDKWKYCLKGYLMITYHVCWLRILVQPFLSCNVPGLWIIAPAQGTTSSLPRVTTSGQSHVVTGPPGRFVTLCQFGWQKNNVTDIILPWEKSRSNGRGVDEAL